MTEQRQTVHVVQDDGLVIKRDEGSDAYTLRLRCGNGMYDLHVDAETAETLHDWLTGVGAHEPELAKGVLIGRGPTVEIAKANKHASVPPKPMSVPPPASPSKRPPKP